MQLLHLLTLVGLYLHFGKVFAYLEEPPTEAAPDTIQDCSWWHIAEPEDSCDHIALINGISLSEFNSVYNPSVGSGCNLVAGNSYCVERNFGLPLPTSSTTTGPTSTATGIPTPLPTQDGMVSNCNKFHFVEPGTSCQSILAAYGVSLDTFFAWNPTVKADCSGLWVNTYACVGTTTGTPTQTTTSRTTIPPPASTGGNGISTPTPTQDGMINTCNKFHFVEPGSPCQSILNLYKIGLATFFLWNPAVKADCSGLWSNTYACVGIIGGVTSSTTTRATTTTTRFTSTGNGISTPTPTQSGMVGNCDRFHLVKTDQGCQEIADSYNIPLSRLYAWNSALNGDCTGLWANVYICVWTVGFIPPTTTTTRATSTTTRGNGIATPTPTQPGMIGNCDTFRLVRSGDTCQSIATSARISLSQFYSWNPSVGSSCASLQLNVYVCIGII